MGVEETPVARRGHRSVQHHQRLLRDLGHAHRRSSGQPVRGRQQTVRRRLDQDVEVDLGSILVHWVVAAHPVHILFHLQHYALTAATTHTGFEGLVIKDRNRLKLGTFHHQMHHRHFECNYGSLELPWDKLFGSFHDGTRTSNDRMKERRKRLIGG